MFSNMSVSVHPSAPPIEYAGVPDALIVFAAARSCANVFGALTPAALKAGTLYQTTDLLAALKTSAYSLPLYVPSCCHAGAKFEAIVDFAYAIDLSLPCFANCATRPGCAMSAMSGGCPPATAVPSTVGMLFPTGLYLTFTLGNVLLNALMTAPNDFASAPVQIPSKVIVPDTALTCEAFAFALVEVPARPAARRASTVASPTTTMRVRLMKLLSWRFRRRFRARSRDRRSAVRVCRPRPRAARRRARVSGHRSVRRVRPFPVRPARALAWRARRRCPWPARASPRSSRE